MKTPQGIDFHYEWVQGWEAPSGCLCRVAIGKYWGLSRDCLWHGENVPRSRQQQYKPIIRVNNYHPLMFSPTERQGSGNTQQ